MHHGALHGDLHFPGRAFLAALFVTLILLLFSTVAAAQPYGEWLVLDGTPGEYVDVPGSADLNPTSAITIESWAFLTVSSGQSCRSFIGKNYQSGWWLGVCGNTLRSFIGGRQDNGGTVPFGQWTHVAVTFDGANRRHYINGELAATFPERETLPPSSSNVRIGSDAAWDFPPRGSLDEVRVWSIARTTEQIRSTINIPITTAQTGLVADWPLDGNGNDVVGGHSGSLVGGLAFLNAPVEANCGTGSATSACLNTRFAVSVQFRNPNNGEYGTGQVVTCPNSDSALFWFFSPNAWEMMVKSVNACSFNNRYWAFSAATTNVFYRLEVTDVRAGHNKVYFNYPGPPAPAVTDTDAFATCP